MHEHIILHISVIQISTLHLLFICIEMYENMLKSKQFLYYKLEIIKREIIINFIYNFH